MKINLPRNMMTDRVDILRTPQAVQDGEVNSVGEGVVEFDVPCKLSTVSASRATTLLGTFQQNAFEAFFDGEVSVEANDVVRVRTSGNRYIVKVARPFPSPEDRQMVVCELAQDESAVKAPVQ